MEDIIEGYIRYREKEGMCKRTQCNDIATLRCVMEFFELYELKNFPRLIHTALGLTGESREVKKRPMPDIIYRITEDRLMEEKRYLVVAIMKLCRVQEVLIFVIKVWRGETDSTAVRNVFLRNLRVIIRDILPVTLQ
ncbi:hypothetical protein OP853_002643 [Salmonella enterica]|nr:hypothetical protein [Salmonella enterica]EKC7220170.1 hypothetical protein [Salmonella enterica]ELC8789611.1 hypothetical protein [Salmonella enterica]